MQCVYIKDAADLAYLNTFSLSMFVGANVVASSVAVLEMVARNNPALLKS